MNQRTIKNLSVPFVAVALSLGAAACGSSDAASDAGTDSAVTTDEAAGTTEAAASDEAVTGDIVITDAWVREPAEGQTLAAGYGTITNNTDAAITLVGASAPITATFEIHETTMGDDGKMSMSEMEGGFEIAPGESFVLEPGGAHIMMLNIDPTEFADSLELTFVFDTTQITVDAPIRPIDGASDDMGDMGDDTMDDTDHAGDETTEMENGDS